MSRITDRIQQLIDAAVRAGALPDSGAATAVVTIRDSDPAATASPSDLLRPLLAAGLLAPMDAVRVIEALVLDGRADSWPDTERPTRSNGTGIDPGFLPHGPSGIGTLFEVEGSDTSASAPDSTGDGKRDGGTEAAIELAAHALRLHQSPTTLLPMAAIAAHDSQLRSFRFARTQQLGRGGMGEVWAARDPDLRREVAVKTMIRPDDPRRLSRFIEEAQVTGQLEHPNIVPVYELGVEDGQPFLVMRRVLGRTLDEVLRDTRRTGHTGLSVEDSARSESPQRALTRLLHIFLKICDAIAFAHSRHVIHRDLKPENVMVGQFGEVFVMDWGLARVLDGAPTGTDEAHDSTSDGSQLQPPVPQAPLDTGRSRSRSERRVGIDSPDTDTDSTSPPSTDTGDTRTFATTDRVADSLTADGKVIGTPAYMPPEQARGEVSTLDGRADVYSLGAILYEILALEPAYRSGTVGFAEMLRQVEAGRFRPPGDRHAPWSVPGELKAIVRKAMDREREGRYESVEAMRADVEAFLAGRPVRAARYSVLDRAAKLVKRHPGAALLTGCLAMVAAIVLISIREVDRQKLERQMAELSLQESEREVGRLREDLSDKLTREQLAQIESFVDHVLEARAAGLPDDEAIRKFGTNNVHRAISAFDARLAARQRYGDVIHVTADDYHHLSMLYGMGLGDHRRAIGLLDQAIRLRPDMAIAFENRAAMRTAIGDLTGALDDLNESIRLEPKARRYRKRGVLRKTLRDHEGALADYGQAIRLNPEDANTWHYRAHLYAQNDNFREALRDATETLRLDPDNAHAWSLRALCREALDDNADARADYDRSVELAPDEPELLVNRARHCLRTGDFEQVMADTAKVIEHKPFHAVAIGLRGQAMCEGGELTEGIAELDRSLEINPRDHEVLTSRGMARLRLGEREGSIADLSRAIDIQPDFVPALLGRAEARWLYADFDGAVSDCLRALEESPGMRHARELLARTRSLSGDTDRAMRLYGQLIDDYPQYPQYRLARAHLLRLERKLEPALADYNRVLEMVPQDVEALTGRGNVHRLMGDIDAALADIRLAATLPSSEFQTAATEIAYARLMVDLDDLEEAEAHARRSIAIIGDQVASLQLLGHILRRQERFEEALDVLERLMKLDPGTGYAAMGLTDRAFARLQLGDLKGAVADASAALALQAVNAEAYRVRGVARRHLGDLYSSEQDLIRALGLNDGFTQAWFDLGQTRDANDDVEGAIAAYDRVLAIDADEPDALYERGRMLRRAGRLEDAVRDLTRALELDDTLAEAFHIRGLAWRDLEQADKALADFSEAIHRMPDFADSFVQRAQLHFSQGRMTECEADCTAVIRLQAEDPQPWAFNVRGYARTHLQRNSEAVTDFSRALDVDPDYWRARRGRAEIYLGTQQWEPARADFARLLEQRPEDWVARFNRGVAEAMLGMFDDAQATFAEVLERCPQGQRNAVRSQSQAVLKAARERHGDDSDDD